jgi:hypothetical protein
MGPERWAQLPLGLTFRLMRMSGEAEEKAKEEMQRALLEERAEVARRRQDGWKRKAARELREGAELDESGEQEAVEIEVPVRAGSGSARKVKPQGYWTRQAVTFEVSSSSLLFYPVLLSSVLTHSLCV